MQFGAIFPQMDGALSRSDIRRWVEGVEGLGFHHILVYEHVLGADPAGRENWTGMTFETPFHEPLTLIAHMAAISDTLAFATGVLVLPQRQTALVAKQAAEADLLAGGRFRLGVGVGWNGVEYEALGQSLSTRGRRCNEQIGLLRRYWTEPVVEFHGEFDQVDRAGINPLPIQRPIPIWVGGDSAAAMHRAGTLGDGWFPHGRPGEDMNARIANVNATAAAAGRPANSVGVEARLTLRELRSEDVALEVDRWRSTAGVTHLGIDTHGFGFRSADHHLETLEGFVHAIGGLPAG